MKYYVGIDLGTTNSAISVYDGSETKIYKSSSGYDVTPSAIYINKRKVKYIGQSAYQNGVNDPKNVALGFKRMMGSKTPIHFPNVDLDMTPEECSAEILKTLFSYLPDEIKNNEEIGTVITVPAAFDVKQKDATKEAATLAGIGKVALMQEPVAAVMSVMKTRPEDGMFLIYDFGGGTLDISVAESINGHVTLHSHGGLSVCGGRDFDRKIAEEVVYPWLLENFKLPEKFWQNEDYKTLSRLITFASEEAKKELSSSDSVTISMSEEALHTTDKDGKEIYLDITLTRERFNELIEKQVNDTVVAARNTLKSAGLTSEDISRIVFIGGPTCYKPLRDKVSMDLGIPVNTDVNPMTAVAEGASIFAESIDWSSTEHTQKKSRESTKVNGPVNLKLNYISRTPDKKARVVIKCELTDERYELQIDSLDSGWSSGKIQLEESVSIDLILSKQGENVFKLFLFDSKGKNISLKDESERIIITRTAANIDSIPASHSVGLEVLDKLGGTPTLEYLVKAGDTLPKKGEFTVRAAETLKAGDTNALKFKLWEGDIKSPITENRFIGIIKISGKDFDDGVIPAGAEINCSYIMTDDGNISLSVSIPCIGGSFENKNFYSRQEGESNYLNSQDVIVSSIEKATNRVEDIEKIVDDERLKSAKNNLEEANELIQDDSDPEKAKAAEEKVYQARKQLAEIYQNHLKEIRAIDLENVTTLFDKLKEFASPSDKEVFENLIRTAKRNIDKLGGDFELTLDQMRDKNFAILWKQDWFILRTFKHFAEHPEMFTDKEQYDKLIKEGTQLIQNDKVDDLRPVLGQLYAIKFDGISNLETSLDVTNIVRN